MENFEKFYSGCVLSLMAAAFIFAVIVLMSGCRSVQYVTVPEYHTDTLIVTNHQRDSIWMHDSIYHMEKGDTILIEKWHTKYRERLVHDTTYISKVDSIPKPYPVEVKVPRELTWWQKTKMRCGVLFMGVICLMGLIGIWKLKKKFGW